MNKKLIRLTETDLHRIVKESIKKVINEVGDKLEKELGLPKGGGKYALARKAALMAQKKGRLGQSDNLEDYGDKHFNDTFGFDNGENRFGIEGWHGVPDFNNETIPSVTAGPEFDDKRNSINTRIERLKAYPRMRAKRGMETYDKVSQARKNWKEQN